MATTRFREMFRVYRKANNLSYRQLATLTGIDFSAIWRFEEGRAVDEQTFAALVTWIMGQHQDKEKEPAAK